MRVILKPGGILLLVVAVGLLSLLVFTRPNRNAEVSETAHTMASVSRAQTLSGETPIFTGDMETFSPVAVMMANTKSKIEGQTAQGFADNSDWAELTVDYSKETANQHGKSAAQKIAIGAISKGQVQFNHYFAAPLGTKIMVVAWLRADKPSP